ncbi:MAG: hypothetical protein LBL66_07700, partial [Clostridiales bacterium]|nr:hypothetical protein [Clostridiales bacterium]
MKRNEVPAALKWNLNHIVDGDGEWERKFSDAKRNMRSVAEWRGKLAGKTALATCLKRRDELSIALESLYSYAHMKADEDTKNDFYKGMLARIRGTYAEFAALSSYIVPELTALDAETLKNRIADPDFRDYDYALSDILRQKAHILSDKEEKLLALAGDFAGSFADVFGMLDNADVKFKPVKNEKGERVELSHGTYSLLLQSGDRRVRAGAFKSMYAYFKAHVNTIAANYSGYVKKNLFYARARAYETCLESFTDGDDVPAGAYKKLVAEVGRALPAVHEYVRLRNAVLNVIETGKTAAPPPKKPRRIHMYDMYTPLVPGAEIALPYAEAYGLVAEALKPMGEEYAALL